MKWWQHRRPWFAPVLVWLAGIAAFWLAIGWVQIFSPDWIFEGFKIRAESADSAWQTIRLWEMWSFGPTTLWWEHVYPPLYDGIRFVLMQPETLRGQEPDVLAVDLRLYWLNSILFGLTAMVVYLWVRDLTGSGRWATVGTVLWSAVPASFAFFVLLYQTGLAIAAMAVAFYLLYRFCRARRYAYAAGFLVALLIASLSRNVVQIHVLLVVVISAFAFWWLARNRRVWMLLVNLGLVALIAFWPARAFFLYGTFDVSTHTGYNRAGALWINPLSVPDFVPGDVKRKYDAYQSARSQLEDPAQLAVLTPQQVQAARSELSLLEQEWQGIQSQYPGVDFKTVGTYPDQLLANATKLSSNWNTQETLKDNYRLGEITNEYILTQPLDATSNALRSLAVTVPTMFRSIYVQWYNGFNYTFPFMSAIDWVFSGWRFALLILLTLAVVVRHFGLRGTGQRVVRYAWFAVFWLLTAIPVLLSNRYWPPEIPEPTHSEADRLRGLIDIPVYVLMALAGFIVVRRVATWRSAQKAIGRHRSTEASQASTTGVHNAS